MNKRKKKCTAWSAAAASVSMPLRQVWADPVDDVIGPINRLATILFAVLRAVGIIVLGYNIFQLVTAVRSHDPSQRSNALIGVVAGIVLILVEPLVYYIIG